jgi:hypothetical protein
MDESAIFIRQIRQRSKENEVAVTALDRERLYGNIVAILPTSRDTSRPFLCST